MGASNKNNTKLIIDIIQWILIIGLCWWGLHLYQKSNRMVNMLVSEKENNEITITYQSSQISSLKKENSELYEKYKNDKTVEYVTKYKYIVQHDTVFMKPNIINNNSDSIHEYIYTSNQNDTSFFNYKIGVWALYQPHKLDFSFTLKDNFTVVNKKIGNINQTVIGTESGTVIEPIIAWRKRETFWERFHYGPQIGGGYGIFNKQLDLYVGFGVSFEIK